MMIQPLPLIVIVIITIIVVQPVVGYSRASSVWAANASFTTITTTTNNNPDLHHNHGYIRGGCNDFATVEDSSAMLQDDNIEDAPAAQEVKDNRNNPEENSIVGEDSASSTTPKNSTRKALTVTSNTVVYTTDADFDEGSLINVNHDDVHDQLQLDSISKPFNVIWVACSGRGTVVKVDTLTGKIVGEYRSAPDDKFGDPSRTTVDKDGSVWVANRENIGLNGNGTIVHIGLLENNQCEDRNGDKIIQTSTGLGDIKAWADESGTRGVQTAEDECIVHYTEVSSTGTRHLSIDADNNVWVSGSSNQAFDKVKGGRYDIVDANGKHSGDILTSYPSVGYGGYGGLIDRNGFLWSADPLLRWDTSKPLIGANGDPAGDSIGPLPAGINWAGQVFPDSYGLCIDSQGNVWNTEFGSGGINKYAPNGMHIGRHGQGSDWAKGCVVGLNDDVWVAHPGETTVGHLKNDGTYLGTVTVGAGPTGVAVDKAGKVWSTNIDDNTLSRIDPSLNGGIGAVDLVPPVVLGDGCSPYNYGDMTGSTIGAPPNTGSWTVKYDHGSVLAAWGSIQWTSATPGDSSLTVQVRNNAVDPWMTVTNGQNLSSLSGQNLYVQVNFSRATSTSSSIGASPVLMDLSLILPTISTPSPTTPVPSNPPTAVPTVQPTVQTSPVPTNPPTALPTVQPTVQTSPVPTNPPTALPTVQPTNPPTASPTMPPTPIPTPLPTTPSPMAKVRDPVTVTTSPTKSPPTGSSGSQSANSTTQNNINIDVNNGSDSNSQNSNQNGNKAENNSDAKNKNDITNDNKAKNENKNVNKNDKKVKKEKKVEKIKQTSMAKNGSNAKNENNNEIDNEANNENDNNNNEEEKKAKNKATMKEEGGQGDNDGRRDDNTKHKDNKRQDGTDKQRDDNDKERGDKIRDDKERDDSDKERGDKQRDDSDKKRDDKERDDSDKKRDDKQRDDNDKERDDKQRDDSDKKRDDKQRDDNDKQRDSNNSYRRKKDERDGDKHNNDSRENDKRRKRNKSNDLFHRF